MACVFPKMVSSQKRRRQCRHVRLPAIRGGATMAARKRPYTEMAITKTTAHGDQLSLRSLNGRWMTTNDRLRRIIRTESPQTDARQHSATICREQTSHKLPKRMLDNNQRPYEESNQPRTAETYGQRSRRNHCKTKRRIHANTNPPRYDAYNHMPCPQYANQSQQWTIIMRASRTIRANHNQSKPTMQTSPQTARTATMSNQTARYEPATGSARQPQTMQTNRNSMNRPSQCAQ